VVVELPVACGGGRRRRSGAWRYGAAVVGSGSTTDRHGGARGWPGRMGGMANPVGWPSHT